MKIFGRCRFNPNYRYGKKQGIRTIYLHGLNKVFVSKFSVGAPEFGIKYPKDALAETLWIEEWRQYRNTLSDKIFILLNINPVEFLLPRECSYPDIFI